MVNQKWKNEFDLLEFLLLDNRLEEERFLPHSLYSKDGDKFLVYFFGKENYYQIRKKDDYGEKYVSKWATGFDDWKYEYVKLFETVLNIPSAVVFYNETEKEFCFRQMLELGKPDKTNWRDTEFHRDLKKLEVYKYGTAEYRAGLRRAVDRLFRNRTGNNKGLALWDIEKLGSNTIYNKRLF